jgi:hypothetical protein
MVFTSPSHAFMQQTLIAELLQQADKGGLSYSSTLQPAKSKCKTTTPHTTIEEMSDEGPRTATSGKVSQEDEEEAGASCQNGEDSDSQLDEVGLESARRGQRHGRKYATRAELNRAAQQRYRQRRKVQCFLFMWKIALLRSPSECGPHTPVTRPQQSI